MKKFLVPIVALAAFVFMACSSATPGEEAIEMVEEATEKVEKAQNISELEAISDEFEAKFNEMEKKYPDYKPSADEEKKKDEAIEKFQEACQKKAMEFVGDLLGDGDDPGEEEEVEEYSLLRPTKRYRGHRFRCPLL